MKAGKKRVFKTTKKTVRLDIFPVSHLIAALHLSYVQVPSAVSLVRDADPRVARYHVVPHRQDGRAVVVDPRHLRKT